MPGLSVVDAAQVNLPPSVLSITSSSTPVPSASYDILDITALATNATIGAPVGAVSNGSKLLIRIKDNGTARTLAFNAVFAALGVTMPTTTVIGKVLYIGTIYNSNTSKWDVVSVAQEA